MLAGLRAGRASRPATTSRRWPPPPRCVIEFSTPEATLANAAICAEHGCAHVIGTTGLTAEQESELRRLAARIAIVWAPNMSVGVNLLLGLVEQVARTLDPSFDIEILEMHHRHKVDAPSGTALALGRAAARGRGVELDEVAARGRDGITGARRAGEIGFAVLRGGESSAITASCSPARASGIELAHVASDRAIYSVGAVRAALWAAGHSRPGSTAWPRCWACARSAPEPALSCAVARSAAGA